MEKARDPDREDTVLRYLAKLALLAAVALSLLAVLSIGGLLDTDARTWVLELVGAFLAADVAFGISRIRRRLRVSRAHGSLPNDGSTEPSASTGFLMSGPGWSLFIGALTLAIVYGLTTDLGAALIGGIFGLVIGAISLRVSLESFRSDRRKRQP